ncbi:MAG: PEP-CTERM-box response regulator transcription factor [Alphaproteobacteria bacterium]|nr:PEP-CTERM-box response regulator transcription factor [Alphaproteobacteria bacterium]
MTEQKRILLVIEDDEGLQRQYKWNFENFETLIAGERQTAMAFVEKYRPAVVLLDLGLPPDPDGTTEGFAILNEILSITPDTKIIVASGHGARESAIRAISEGAYDFYQKPVDADEIGFIVDRAFRLYDLEQENKKLQQREETTRLPGLVTASEQMEQVCSVIERVSPTSVSVLLLGGSGTGKELLARALHDLSDRNNMPFVAINCGAIPENLIESELFGFEKGAFTGAMKQVKGKIELAEGGTLFLDEIGDLPLPLQVKLLRFLQERVIERIGGRKEIPVDVRVISATHQRLEDQITDGRFREDLFYRLSEIVVNIPDLKDRDGDALLLAHNFLNKFSRAYDKRAKSFDKDAARAIASYDWPGNVRELENRIKRAVIMSDSKKITLDDLEIDYSDDHIETLNLKEIREKNDKAAMLKALSLTNGNISETARLLGISRPTFYGLVKQYDLNIDK